MGIGMRCLFTDRLAGIPITGLCLLLVTLTGCSTVTRQSVQSTDEWIQCKTDEFGEAWVCVSGRGRTKAPVSAANPPDAVSARALVESEVSPKNPNADDMPSVNDAVSMTAARPSGFSIQLAAFRSAERRDRYVDSLPLVKDDLILTESEQGGQSWSLVLYGDYPSLSEARIAQDRLRQNLGIQDSWIKPARTP